MYCSKLSLTGTFGVEEGARRLKRFYYVERSLARLMAGWLIRIPIWEIKLRIPYAVFQCTEHADWLRSRVIELRYPALDVDEGFDTELDQCMEVAFHAPSWPEGLAAMQEIRTQLIREYEQYLEHTLPVGDWPTIRLLKRIMTASDEQSREFGQMMNDLSESEQAQVRHHRELLQRCMARLGGLAGNGVHEEQGKTEYIPTSTFHIPSLPARDERFRSSVLRHTEAPTSYEELRVYRFRTLMDEMSAVEVLCGCLVDSPRHLPWDYYKDLGRWIWDEGRHCEMGFEGIKRLGIDPFETGYINNYGSYAFSSGLPVVERIAVLSLLSETATIPFKIQCKEDYEQAHDEISAQVFDYDWADEAIHVTFGNRWAPVLVNHDTEALGTIVQEVTKKWIDWGLKMAKDPEKNGTYGLFRYFQEGEWRL